MSYSARSVDTRKLIFISYSQNDKEWLDKLNNFLVPLARNNLIQIWDESQLKPGDVTSDEINKSLNAAKAALLLVTQQFF